MPILKAANHAPRSLNGMKKSITYILNPKKVPKGLSYVSGLWDDEEEITPSAVVDRFIDDKQFFEKLTGRQCLHYILSWNKEDAVTPERALEFTKDFFERTFPDFQSVFAVHYEPEISNTVHVHAVMNSVSFIDGRKFHQSAKDLEKQKNLVNEMAIERGMLIPEKGKHFDGTEMKHGEIIAWSKDKYQTLMRGKGTSYLLDCADIALRGLKASTKEGFIRIVQAYGWDVDWSEKRKHIVFIGPNGEKVRDTNLGKTFGIDVSKEFMEQRFRSVNSQLMVMGRSLRKNSL